MVPRFGLLVLLAVLLLACSDKSPGIPTPTFDSPTPTIGFPRPVAASPTPWPELALERLPDTTVSRPGAYVLNTQTGSLTRVGDRGGPISPSGKLLATGLCCLGQGYVDIIDLETGQTSRTPTGDVARVVWSPESNRLAYSVRGPSDQAGVYVINADGTGNRKLSQHAGVWTLAWTRLDHIVYSVQTQPMVAPESYFRIDLSTNSVTQLQTHEPPTADDPRILLGTPSPNREWVAFSDNGSFLWHRLTGDVVEIPGPAESWSPDGGRLLLALPYGGPVTPDWRVMSFSDLQPVDVPAVGLWPAWLDERRIASIGFRCSQGTTVGEPDLVVSDVVAGTSRNFTNTPDIRKYELTVSPSRDIGAFIIPGPPYQLMLVDFATEQIRLAALGTEPDSDIHTHNFLGAWSADGSLLQFAVRGGHGICN